MKKELSLTILTLLALVATLIGGYYVFVSLPREQDLRSLEMEFSRRREMKLTDCLEQADSGYHEHWDKTCKAFNLEAGCVLEKDSADGVEDWYRKYQDRCYLEHPKTRIDQ